MIYRYFFLLFSIMCVGGLSAQVLTDSIIAEKGKFDRWAVYEIKESGVIGGATKWIYKLTDSDMDTVGVNKVFVPEAEDCLAPCNVMAEVVGIIKCSNTVTPERRGDGYCAKLSVLMEEVKVLGIINLEVLVQGTILTGHFNEPIHDTKSPYSKMEVGYPYTGRPSAIEFDYKADVGYPILRSTGFSPKKNLPGNDYPFVRLFLQHRVEDEKGRVTAKRVGTAYWQFTEDAEEWVNGFRIPVRYGDISGESDFVENGMGLMKGDIKCHCRNSKGKLIPIDESEWATDGEDPTHIVIWISSSSGEAFHGGLGNTLWIDNLKLITE